MGYIVKNTELYSKYYTERQKGGYGTDRQLKIVMLQDHADI